METSPYQRQRSCLSVPGSSARKLEKARELAVDRVVFDLEDAVIPAAKAAARRAVADAIRTWRGPPVAVRVNAIGTPWCHLDVMAVVSAGAGSVVVPKVEGPGDIAFVARLLDGIEAGDARLGTTRVQALIETPLGVTRVSEVASASHRLEALITGYADLGAALDRAPGGLAWLPIQDAVVVAARAHGLLAIDGPHLGTAPDQSFIEAARMARDIGFDGKWVIHPSQAGPLNEVFTPTAEEVTKAQRVLDAIGRAEAEQGQGATSMEGQMLDEAVRLAAHRVLARAVPQ